MTRCPPFKGGLRGIFKGGVRRPGELRPPGAPVDPGVVARGEAVTAEGTRPLVQAGKPDAGVAPDARIRRAAGQILVHERFD